MSRVPLLERFESKINKTDSCWLWTACTWRGYGRFQLDNTTTRQAHRVAYELYKGPIPKGGLLCHTCDVPSCVNPAHLYVGTQQDNMTDRVVRGRWKGHMNPGEAHPYAKLNDDLVRQIRKDVGSYKQLGIKYGVSGATIGLVKTRKRWSHVE